MRDVRRRRETDREYVRLHTGGVTLLPHSLRRYLRDLIDENPQAKSLFIARHAALIENLYRKGYTLGQQQYWRRSSHLPAPATVKQPPDTAKLTFYTVSVPKMAEQLQSALQAPAALDESAAKQWVQQAAVRIDLQADVAWSGAQDGYTQMALGDPARPYNFIYWILDPGAQHCSDCPDYAAGSPYGWPGSHNNELSATPGDGSTACGAACKCDLEYGPGPDDDIGDWSPMQPPSSTEPGYTTTPLVVHQPQAPAQELTNNQIYALDSFRQAANEWEHLQQRFFLPDLGTLFAPNAAFLEQDLTAADPAIRKAILKILTAVQNWRETMTDTTTRSSHQSKPLGKAPITRTKPSSGKGKA